MTIAITNAQGQKPTDRRACCSAGDQPHRLHHNEPGTVIPRTTVTIALVAIVALTVAVRLPYLKMRSL